MNKDNIEKSKIKVLKEFEEKLKEKQLLFENADGDLFNPITPFECFIYKYIKENEKK